MASGGEKGKLEKLETISLCFHEIKKEIWGKIGTKRDFHSPVLKALGFGLDIFFFPLPLPVI